MTYSISCVLLIPSANLDQINALAESLGYGPGNLSAQLEKANGDKWFGCHTWCSQKFLDQLADPAYAGEARSALVVSAIPGGNAWDNWAQALESNDLTVISDNETNP